MKNERKEEPRNSGSKQNRNKRRKFSNKPGSGSQKPIGRKDRKIEVDVSDNDVNAADLRPFDKRRSKTHDNDFSWYNHYPVLVENASGVNYASSVGSEIKWFTNSEIYNTGVPSYSAPGICTLRYLPTYGKLDSTVETPLSRVWAQLYSAMRIKLGSRADYDPTDTLLYIIAMDSAYTLYGLAAKAYGLTNQVSPFNLYLMKAMCYAAGFDYSSISKNRAAFRDILNQFAITLSKYMVPADLDIFKRHMWLTQNVFTDSSTAKAQLYNFRPEGIYMLQEMTTGDKKLKFMELKGTGTNSRIVFGDFENWFNAILLALDNSQDLIQMSADIAKAWESKTLAAALIPETYVAPISYSQEVLSQIENITLTGKLINSTVDGEPNLDITVEQLITEAEGPRLKQSIWTHPVLNASSGAAEMHDTINNKACNMALLRNGFLNFHWPQIKNEDTIIASRGIVNIVRVGMPTGQSVNCTQIGDCGAEVFTYAELYGNTKNGLTTRYYSWAMGTSYTNSLAAMWSSFDWAPAYFSGLATSASDLDVNRMQDIDMYGVIDRQQIAMMHYSCILSLFYSDVYPESVVNMPSM